MKVILVDNFDREGPGAVVQKVIAGPGLSCEEAERIANKYNAKSTLTSSEYYRVVEDDYILAKPWEP